MDKLKIMLTKADALDIMTALDVAAGVMRERGNNMIEKKYLRLSNRVKNQYIKNGVGVKLQPAREGSARCESGSIASGGDREFCTCDVCF